MGDRTDPGHSRRRRRGRVLSGGPRDPRLGPASHFWVADSDRTSGPSRLAPAEGGLATGPHPGRLAEPPPPRLRPSLVAYPLRLRRPSPQLVRWTILGGLGDLGAGETLEDFRPSSDLVFALGVELVGPTAQRLGYAAASTTVHPGSPGRPHRPRCPRLVCLVGTAPRAALAELGEQLLWKGAWST